MLSIRSAVMPAGIAGAVGLGAVALLFAEQARPGYDDTPMQPDGKWRVHDSRRPPPRVVEPASFVSSPPPADAVVLLGPDHDLSAWQMNDGTPVRWAFSEGVLQSGKGNIRTRAEFTDIQLHLEFATPVEVKGSGQGRGNSGVYLGGSFEIQVLDSFENPTYADGQAAAMYGQHPPLVNASRGPGEWQSYDIAFMAPRFAADGTLSAPAVVTVFHNGVLVHHARPFWGPTEHRKIEPYVPSTARGPLRLQDHENPVRFRNIWLRELSITPGVNERAAAVRR